MAKSARKTIDSSLDLQDLSEIFDVGIFVFTYLKEADAFEAQKRYLLAQNGGRPPR